MRYSVFRSSKVGVAAFPVVDLPNAIWRAQEMLEERSPGTTIYIQDHEADRRISEDEIREIAQTLPPRSRSMFGNDDA